MSWNMANAGAMGAQGQQHQQAVAQQQLSQQQQQQQAGSPQQMAAQQMAMMQQQRMQAYAQQQAAGGVAKTQGNAGVGAGSTEAPGDGGGLSVITTGNDGNEVVMKTLVGDYVEKGENHGRKVYQKKSQQDVFIYYWDNRDGPNFEGWWFGKSVGGDEVWSHASSSSAQPPGKGWKIPFAGPVRETLEIVPKGVQQTGQQAAQTAQTAPAHANFSQEQRQQAEENISQLAEEAKTVINAYQEASKEADVSAAVASFDVDGLKKADAIIQPHTGPVRDLTAKLSSMVAQGVAMNSAKQVLQQAREAMASMMSELNRIKAALPKAMQHAQMKQAYEAEKAIVEAVQEEILKKTEAAEDIAEKATITFGILEKMGEDEDIENVRTAMEQTEAAVSEAETAVRSGLTFVGQKAAEVTKLRTRPAQEKVNEQLNAMRVRMKTCFEKLQPLKSVRQDFTQREAAVKVIKEIIERVTPAEMDVDRTEEVATTLKEDMKNKGLLRSLEQSLSESDHKMKLAQRAVDVKLKSASGFLKRELDKINERLKVVTKRLTELKNTPQMVIECVAADAICSESAEKLKCAEEAVQKMEQTLQITFVPQEANPQTADEALAAVKQAEIEATAAKKAVTTARVGISTGLIEVRRYKAESQQAIQTKLQSFKDQLEQCALRLAGLSVKAVEAQCEATHQQVNILVAEAEVAAAKLAEAALGFSDETAVKALSTEQLREAAASVATASSLAQSSIKTAQEILIKRQIEAKTRDAPVGLSAKLTDLQARLRRAEADVRASKKLPDAVQEQLTQFEKVEEVAAKVRDIEAKAEAATARVKAIAEEAASSSKPLSETIKKVEEEVHAHSSGAKATMRFMETHARTHTQVSEEIKALRPRIEAVQERFNQAMTSLRLSTERVNAARVVKEVAIKADEAEDALKKATEAAAPLTKAVAEGIEIDDKEVDAVTTNVEKLGTLASTAISRARSVMATKRLVVKKLPDGVAKTATEEELTAFQTRMDDAANKLMEIRRAVFGKKYAASQQEALARVAETEEKVKAALEAGKKIPDAEDGQEAGLDTDELKAAMSAATTAQAMAQTSVNHLRGVLWAQMKGMKATAGESPILDEMKNLLDKVKTLETELTADKQRVLAREEAATARKMLDSANALFTEVDDKLAHAESLAAPLVANKDKLMAMASLSQALGALRDHMQSSAKTPESLFGEIKSKGGGSVTEEAFVTYVEELSNASHAAINMTKDQVKAAFSALDGQGAAQLSQQSFLEHFKSRYCVVSVVAMTTALDLAGSKTLCRLEVGEVLEVLDGTNGEEVVAEGADAGDGKVAGSGVRRVWARRERDGKEGYVSISGNQGTKYLEAYSLYAATVKRTEAALKDALDKCNAISAFLRQKSEEVQSKSSGPLADVRAKLVRMQSRCTSAMQTQSDLKKRVAEARKRYSEVLEKEQKRKHDAVEQRAADKMVKEATGLVDNVVSQTEKALATAEELVSSKGAGEPNPLESMMRGEKDLEAAKALAQKAYEQVVKSDYEKVKSVTNGPLADVRRAILRQKVRLGPLEGKIAKTLSALAFARSRVASDAREGVADVLRRHSQKNAISYEALYEKLRRPSDGQITIDSLREYLKGIADSGLADGQLDLALTGLAPGVTRMGLQGLMQEYLRCAKDVAITDGLQVNKTSSTLRKLEPGEVVEVLKARAIDPTIGLERLQCRALADNTEGWITLRGNQGTVFMQGASKPYYMCKTETPLQADIEGTGGDVLKAAPGVVLELLEGPRAATALEVQRVRGKARSDGKVGWVTLKDSTGKEYFETSAIWVVKTSTALTDDFDIAKANSILRKLDVGETLTLVNETSEDDERGLTRVKIRAELDGLEGWATLKGNHGTTFLEESVVRQVGREAVALQVAFASKSRMVRMLQPGEAFEVTDGPRTEVHDGARRARGRILRSSDDGPPHEGWFTISEGMLEKWTPRYRCVRGTNLLHGAEPSAGVIRPLKVGEHLEVMEAPIPTDSASPGRLLRLRAELDGAVGYAADYSNRKADGAFLEPVLRE